MNASFFGQQVLHYFFNLQDDFHLPSGITSIFPFKNQETQRVMTLFFEKYYSDTVGRHFIFGINPGRFGSGITGIGFSDGPNLSKHCAIPNSFDSRKEMSANFIYEVIEAYGGADTFYQDFYITATSPIGFVKDGKNYNYYDDKSLEKSVRPFIVDSMKKQIEFGLRSRAVVCVGQGKNLKYLQELNDKYRLFDSITSVPHPRWVMQYKRKDKLKYIDRYIEVLYGISQPT